jgi:ABC-type branched-subunit amino acid transport system substrate-binding protein
MQVIRTIPLLFLAFSLHAAPPELLIGATLPLSGVHQEQGQMVQDGLRGALLEAAASDPDLRKRIRLEILDDQGDPVTAARNAEKLISQNQVQALAGCVGEAVCAAVEAVARRHQVPLLGLVHANDEVCREKSLAFCFHDSYSDEADAIARQLKTLGTSLVHLWVSDSLARYETRVSAAFTARNLAVVAHRPGKDQPKAQADKLDEAYVLLLNNEDAVTTTRRLRQVVPSALIGAFSSIEPFKWLQKTQGLSSGVLVAHTLPNPDLGKSRLTKAYQKAMAEFSTFNLPYEYAQLESYLVGRLLSNLARQGIADKQALIRAISQNEHRIDDVDIAYANGKRTLSLPVGLSVVGRNGVLLE